MPERLRYSHRQVSAVPHKNGSLEAALAQLRGGGMVVVCDDPDRENEGDLCMAAQFVTAEKIAFMACEARGLICLSLPSQRCDELELPLMVPANDGCDATGFTVSIEARTGVTTGISAADRARTIQVAIDPDSGPEDLVRPGHIFPLRARPNGVLERRGQTEAAIFRLLSNISSGPSTPVGTTSVGELEIELQRRLAQAELGRPDAPPRHNVPPLRNNIVAISDRFFDRTIPQAATMILREANGPLHVNEIYNQLLEGGFSFTGNNPTISIAVSLNRNTRFRKVAPGTFDLVIRDAAKAS